MDGYQAQIGRHKRERTPERRHRWDRGQRAGAATYLRVLLVVAATVVVLAGMRLAAPVLNPIIFAVVLSLLFGPVYAWLGRRGFPTLWRS